jgi:hypothetical protein
MSWDRNVVRGQRTPLGRCLRSAFVGLVALAPPLDGQAKQGPFCHVNYYQVRSGDEQAYDSALVNVRERL